MRVGIEVIELSPIIFFKAANEISVCLKFWTPFVSAKSDWYIAVIVVVNSHNGVVLLLHC